MKNISLGGTWTLSGKNPDTNENLTLSALVPGCVLNDIVRENVENCDIFYRDNSEKFEKYEMWDWHYHKTFSLDEVAFHTELFFSKLDTYCDVYLNDTLLSSCQNGYISYCFNVDGIIKCGENKIDVYFRSPIREVKDKPLRVGAFTKERMNTRRMQCTYGWDWVARFVTCGIGEVSINSYAENEPRVDSVYVYTKSFDSFGAYIGISANINESSLGNVYTFEVVDSEGNVVKTHKKYISYPRYDFNLSIEDAKLWYPRGYGEQNLYTLKVFCDETEIHSELFGIRTVKIIQETDEKDSEYYNKCLFLKDTPFNAVYDKNEEFSSFILVVNGIKVLCMGANWVPCEPFDVGGNDKKIDEILSLACEMGLNMIRVWGGGAFECKHFYDECSRRGIMVTQDFLMACGQYPEKEDWFIKELSKEAEYAAKLMRNEPCLMWWSGDNENATGGSDTMEDYTGRSSATYGIHPILMNLDPMRDFLPSSPYGGNLYASNTTGTSHNTNRLGDIFACLVNENDPLCDYKERMKKYTGRFIAEEPTFGAVSTYSAKKFMTDEDIFGDDNSIREYHTKSNPDLPLSLYGYFELMAKKLMSGFGNGKDRHFKLKYVQYENVRVAMELLRRERWFSSGLIFWQLNDCWPAYSGWALIDYYNMPKASFYAFKNASKPVKVLCDKVCDKYSVLIANDGENDAVKGVKVFTLDVKSGERKDLYEGTALIEKGETVVAFECEKDDDTILFAEINGDRAYYMDGVFDIAECDVDFTLDEEKGIITIKSDKYLRAVELEGNLVAEDNYFSLLPGEERCIKYRKQNKEKALELSVKAYTVV